MATSSGEVDEDQIDFGELLDGLAKSAWRWRLSEPELRALVGLTASGRRERRIGSGHVRIHPAQITRDNRIRMALVIEIDSLLATSGFVELVPDWLRKPNVGLQFQTPLEVMSSCTRLMRCIRDMLRAEAIH